MSANDSSLLFTAVCGAENLFWDSKLSWHTSTPDLPLCFLKVIPIWIPAAILCLLTLLVRINDCNARSRRRKKKVAYHTDYVIKQEATEITQKYKELPSLTFYDLMTRWRRWSLLFSLKLFAISSLLFFTVFGNSINN